MSTGRWRATTGILKRTLIWVAILSIWEGAYRLTAFDAARPDEGGWRPWRFPAPSHVFDALLETLNVNTGFGEPLREGWPRAEGAPARRASWWNSPLVEANLVSGLRLTAGFAFSILLGGTLGLLMWRSAFLDDLLGPLFLGLQTLPSVCWVPLGIMLFGLSETGILFVLVMGSFFAVAIAMRDGLRMIPPIYLRAGNMLGAYGWRKYRYVLLPASLPALASSLRQGFSFAWRSLLGAELIFFVQHKGLGFLLTRGREIGGIEDVVAVMIVMVAIGMTVDRLVFAKLQRRVQSRFGLVAAR